VAKARRLRRLSPDPELFDRRVAGESLRTLAPDYRVAHTTLLRYFGRPDVRIELREARRRLLLKRKALAAQRAEERLLKQDVRRRAREQAARERNLLRLRAIAVARPRRSGIGGWLDEHEAPRGLLRRERWSEHDRVAEQAVAAGGGVDEVIAVTGLRTRENVYRLIDPETTVRALANQKRRRPAAESGPPRLRRLAPDDDLIRRRAAGETLRRLAGDYAVSHTTVCRYFARPQIAKELRTQQEALRDRRQRDVQFVERNAGGGCQPVSRQAPEHLP
jgi:hypothetical protein